MLGAMDPGVTDDGERTGHEQAALIAVWLFIMSDRFWQQLSLNGLPAPSEKAFHLQ
jgi:hypothetical protein